MGRKSLQCKHIPDWLILSMIDSVWQGIRCEGYHGPMPYEILIDRGFPEKVVYAKYSKLDRVGYLEWGVSLRTAWLSDEGEEYLKRLKADKEVYNGQY